MLIKMVLRSLFRIHRIIIGMFVAIPITLAYYSLLNVIWIPYMLRRTKPCGTLIYNTHLAEYIFEIFFTQSCSNMTSRTCALSRLFSFMCMRRSRNKEVEVKGVNMAMHKITMDEFFFPFKFWFVITLFSIYASLSQQYSWLLLSILVMRKKQEEHIANCHSHMYNPDLLIF